MKFMLCILLVVILTCMVMHTIMTNTDMKYKQREHHERLVRALDKHVVQPLEKAKALRDTSPRQAFYLVDNAYAVFLTLETLTSDTGLPNFEELCHQHSQDLYTEITTLHQQLLPPKDISNTTGVRLATEV
jgi:hypothetical protein